jgi:hypothetical protein
MCWLTPPSETSLAQWPGTVSMLEGKKKTWKKNKIEDYGFTVVALGHMGHPPIPCPFKKCMAVPHFYILQSLLGVG